MVADGHGHRRALGSLRAAAARAGTSNAAPPPPASWRRTRNRCGFCTRRTYPLSGGSGTGTCRRCPPPAGAGSPPAPTAATARRAARSGPGRAAPRPASRRCRSTRPRSACTPSTRAARPGRTRSAAAASSRRCRAASRSTAAGSTRQRRSARRRSVPRPEHGASTSTRSNEPGRHGGRVPSATTTATPSAPRSGRRWPPPARRAPGRTSAATTRAPAAGERGGLAAGRGAQVEHPVARPRRRPRSPPAATPGPGRSRRPARSTVAGSFIAVDGGQRPRRARDRPPEPARPSRARSAGWRRRATPPATSATRRSTALTRPRAGRGATPTVSDTAACGGDAGERELVGAEAQGVADRASTRAGQEPVDQVVARPPHPGRAVHEVGDEPAVGGRPGPTGRAPRTAPGWRRRPRRRCGRARRAPPRRAEGWTPRRSEPFSPERRPRGARARSAVGHRAEPGRRVAGQPAGPGRGGHAPPPSGCTSTSQIGPSPAARRRHGPRSGGRGPGPGAVRHTLSRWPRWVVHAPPIRTSGGCPPPGRPSRRPARAGRSCGRRWARPPGAGLAQPAGRLVEQQLGPQRRQPGPQLVGGLVGRRSSPRRGRTRRPCRGPPRPP